MKKRILLQKSFLFLFVLTISTNLSATTPNSYLFDNIKEWVGGTGNWNVPSNWSPVGVPDGFSIILIGAGDNVTLPTGYTSNSLQVKIEKGGTLTIQSGGTLNCNGAQLNGFYIQNAGSSLVNNGTINIGNIVEVGGHGMVVMDAASLTNNAGAIITINSITSLQANQGMGIYTEGATLTNAGNIIMGDLGSITNGGLSIVGAAKLINTGTGLIEIHNITNGHGITMITSGTSLANDGTINIGKRSTLQGGHGIYQQTGSVLTNGKTGMITINNTTGDDGNDGCGYWATGIGTVCTNSGSINIGNTASIYRGGMFVAGKAQLTNQSGATIQVNNVSYSSGVIVSSLGKIINNGVFHIGNTNDIYELGLGILSASEFENNAGGTLTINRTKFSDGIFISGINSKFTNSGTTSVGNLAPIGLNGITMESGTTFTNNSTGIFTIENVGKDGMVMYASSIFNNLAGSLLEINNLKPNKGNAIYTNGEFTNSGDINIATSGNTIYRGIERYYKEGTFSNNGTINFGKISNYAIGSDVDLQNNSGGVLQTTADGKLRNDGTIINNDGGIIRNTTTLLNTGIISLAHINAKIENNAGATFTNRGIVKGVGTIVQNGTVENNSNAKIQPGLSPGTLTVVGDFNLGDGTLQMEVDGTSNGSFDLLNISGQAILTDAKLNVTSSITPEIGQSITILKSAMLVGTFSAVTLGDWQLNYNYPLAGQITLTFKSALPLTLLSFTGTKQNTDALLQWKTTNEVNVSKYEIHRSEDGLIFKTVGTVLPGGNNYNWTDINIFNSKQTVFYRLKSIDNDNKFTYSNIIRLNSTSSNQFAVFPNPVKDLVTISGLQPNATISLFTAAGKLLKKQIVTAQSVTLDMSPCTKGIYILQYFYNGEIISQKIVKE